MGLLVAVILPIHFVGWTLSFLLASCLARDRITEIIRSLREEVPPIHINVYGMPLGFKLGGRPILSDRLNVETAGGSERKLQRF